MSAWQGDQDCVWRQNGVWNTDPNGTPHLLRPDHFAHVNGHQARFSQDYYRPFANRFAKAIREVDPDALIFIESTPERDSFEWGTDDAPRVVYAPHWYDAWILVFKKFSALMGIDSRRVRVVWLPSGIRRSFAAQLDSYKQQARGHLRGAPVHLGEIGIPFDIDGGRAYRTGDFSLQERALDRSLRAIEDNIMNTTIWNYTPDNDNARGDQWNGEDFSVFSRDQQRNPTDVSSGGRGLRAFLRPYPKATAGEPMRLSFEMNRRVFRYEFSHDPLVEAPTEVFVPRFQYPKGYRVRVSDGRWESDSANQLLRYWHTMERDSHTILITAR